MFAQIGVFADTGEDWDHMGGWGGGWMWLWGVVMMALFVVLIAWLVQTTGGGASAGYSPQRSPVERAQEILAERYARGDLTTEEYRERVAELQ